MSNRLKNRYISSLYAFRKDPELKGKLPQRVSTRHLHNLVIDFQRHREHDWPKEVYYYCSVEVAYWIIKCGRMWLTDVRKMNDSTEMLYAVEYLQQHIEQLSKNKSLPDGFLNLLNNIFDDLTESTEWQNTLTFNSKLILAMCFTQLKDDASMWDRYGKSGEGVSIHFNLSNLLKVVTYAGIFTPNTSTYENGIIDVCYPEENNQCSCMDKIVDQLLAAHRKAKNQDEHYFINYLLEANILEFLMSHKHNSFSSEKEFRIYSKAPAEQTWMGDPHIYEHRVGSTKSVHAHIILPHCAIGISEDEFWQGLISGVTLGPRTGAFSHNLIQSALDSRNISDSLIKSSCPLQKF